MADIPAAFNSVFSPEQPFSTSEECLEYLIEMYKVIDCVPHKAGLTPEQHIMYILYGTENQ